MHVVRNYNIKSIESNGTKIYLNILGSDASRRAKIVILLLSWEDNQDIKNIKTCRNKSKNISKLVEKEVKIYKSFTTT